MPEIRLTTRFEKPSGFRASSLGRFLAKNGGSAVPSFGRAFIEDCIPPISRHYGVRYTVSAMVPHSQGNREL